MDANAVNQQDEFDWLRKKHAEKVQEYNEIKKEVTGETWWPSHLWNILHVQVRRDLLKNIKIIGRTTTGT